MVENKAAVCHTPPLSPYREHAAVSGLSLQDFCHFNITNHPLLIYIHITIYISVHFQLQIHLGIRHCTVGGVWIHSQKVCWRLLEILDTDVMVRKLNVLLHCTFHLDRKRELLTNRKVEQWLLEFLWWQMVEYHLIIFIFYLGNVWVTERSAVHCKVAELDFQLQYCMRYSTDQGLVFVVVVRFTWSWLMPRKILFNLQKAHNFPQFTEHKNILCRVLTAVLGVLLIYIQ